MRGRLDNGVKYGCFLGVKPMSGALRLVTCEVLASSRTCCCLILILLLLLTSGIAYPHRQQLHHYGHQHVVLVTNHNYVTETTGVTAAIRVQGGVAPHVFVRTRFSLIASRPPKLF